MSDKKPNQVLLCSTLAGIICNSLTNPLDVIKVRLQNDAKKCHCTHPSLCVNRSSPTIKAQSISNISVFKLVKCRNIETDFRVQCGCLPFRTNIKALVYLVRKEGVLTLANGLRQGVFASTISAVTFLSFYEARKRVTNYTRDAILVPFFTAFVARTLTTSLIFPFEYWRTVQQSSIGAFKSSSQVKLGRNFNAGFSSLLLRDIVFACINWVLIENIRTQIKHFVSEPVEISKDEKSYQNKQTLLLSNFLSGAIAGGIASYISIPFDVVKTRKQLHPKEYKHKSTLQILNEVYQTEGKKGLFLGGRQRGWKVTLQTAGIITLYELFMDMMRDKQLEMI